MALDVTDHLRRHAPGVFARGARIAIWGVLHWAIAFLEQVLEVVAPLVLVCGLGWWALPRLLGLVATDGQVHDMLADVITRFPTELHVGGVWLSAAGLIVDGLLLMALAALLQTVAAVITYEIYER